MLIDLLVSKSTPVDFLPHEEYILENIIHNINKQRNNKITKKKSLLHNYDTGENIEVYRRLDHVESLTAVQCDRCLDLIHAIIDRAWKDAMGNGFSIYEREARAWWLSSDNKTRKWLLGAIGISDLEQKLKNMIREHIKKLKKT